MPIADREGRTEEMAPSAVPNGTAEAQVWVLENGRPDPRLDALAIEEPLEIRLRAAWTATSGALPVFARRGQRASQRTVAITMRTPGNDAELAAGFLHGEGILQAADEIERIGRSGDPTLEDAKRENIVEVDLRAGVLPDLAGLERHFYTTSACGVCGKASLDALRLRRHPSIGPGPVIHASMLHDLPARLRAHQALFSTTGGLHAAALFDVEGHLLCLRENVGRHNAEDKVVGWALLARRLPLKDHVLMVSGRSSFEILQKCLMAGVPIVCAVSAPSSLAVALARDFGITLIGFLRGERFNVYAGPERIAALAAR